MIGFDLKLSGSAVAETADAPPRTLPSPVRVGAYLTVIGGGLLVGAMLGTIIALFSGLIDFC
jgi:hypothetical protein